MEIRKNKGGDNISQKPPLPQSYWRFLAEKVLQDVTSPFEEAKTSSASAQVACTHRVCEIVADKLTRH